MGNPLPFILVEPLRGQHQLPTEGLGSRERCSVGHRESLVDGDRVFSCQQAFRLQPATKGRSGLAGVALQLMVPFHHIFLAPELYGRYLDTDFFDEKKRMQKISQMVDCVLSGRIKEVEQ
jgi:hypothetical protein